VESDATSRTPDSSVSFEIPLTVTRDENHVADEDTEDAKTSYGQVHDSVAAGQGRRNPQKLHGSLQI